MVKFYMIETDGRRQIMGHQDYLIWWSQVGREYVEGSSNPPFAKLKVSSITTDDEWEIEINKELKFVDVT